MLIEKQESKCDCPLYVYVLQFKDKWVTWSDWFFCVLKCTLCFEEDKGKLSYWLVLWKRINTCNVHAYFEAPYAINTLKPVRRVWSETWSLSFILNVHLQGLILCLFLVFGNCFCLEDQKQRKTYITSADTLKAWQLQLFLAFHTRFTLASSVTKWCHVLPASTGRPTLISLVHYH